MDLTAVRGKVGDVDGLAGLFFTAAEVEQKMPQALNKRIRSAWPETAPDPNLSYGYNETEVRRGAATSAEVDLYDVALELSLMFEEGEAKLVWLAAHSQVRRERGVAWRRIARLMGMHPATAKRRFERAILGLWFKLQDPVSTKRAI